MIFESREKFLLFLEILEKGNSRMLGDGTMSTLESNIALISTIPEDMQEQIHTYLITNFFDENPFKPLSQNEILEELAESRDCYARGEYKEFDEALDEISEKYGI